MASEIRVNQIQNRSGLGTVTFSDTGVVISGITTISDLRTSGNTIVAAGTTSAPSISPTGDSNTGIFFPSADTVAIAEGGVEILRVNSSGNIGIGTTDSLNKFEVGNVSGGVTAPDFTVSTVSLGSSVTIGRLSSVGSDNTFFRVRDRVNRTLISATVGGVDIGSTDVTTPLTIRNGNLVFSTAGTGIDFSATANSSGGTMTSELLSDYEEGTWTPYWSNSTGTNLFVNNDITVFQAFYRKINNMIFYSTYFYSDTSFSYNTGMNSGTPAYIGGLPFVAHGYHAGMVGYFVNWSGWDSSGYGFIPMLISEAGASTLRIQYPSVGGVSQVTAGTLSASSGAIICSGIYFTS